MREKFLKSQWIIAWWAAIICLAGVGLWATIAIHTHNSVLLTNATKITNTTEAAKFDKQGVALFYSGKYNQSIAYFDKALAIEPKNINALTMKGDALFYLGKYRESITSFDKALAVNPNHFYALNGKGASLVKLGKYNESIAYLDKALSISPKNVNALNYKKLALGALAKK